MRRYYIASTFHLRRPTFESSTDGEYYNEEFTKHYLSKEYGVRLINAVRHRRQASFIHLFYSSFYCTCYLMLI